MRALEPRAHFPLHDSSGTIFTFCAFYVNKYRPLTLRGFRPPSLRDRMHRTAYHRCSGHLDNSSLAYAAAMISNPRLDFLSQASMFSLTCHCIQCLVRPPHLVEARLLAWAVSSQDLSQFPVGNLRSSLLRAVTWLDPLPLVGSAFVLINTLR
jgi:hypothetical protein